jgi:hypothetical protein
MIYLFTHLCIYFCACFLIAHGVRVDLHNPSVFQSESKEEIVNFSMSFDNSLETHWLNSNTSPISLCFQLNGKDCHCFNDVIDISLYLFTVPESCKVSGPKYNVDSSSSHFPNVWFSIRFSKEGNGSVISTPTVLYQHLTGDEAVSVGDLTLILPLTLDDLSRALLLFTTLVEVDIALVQELLVISPDTQVSLLESSLTSLIRDLKLPVRFIPESTLFSSPKLLYSTRLYPYGIQMALKLLVSRIIQTPFYLTLDADILLLKPNRLKDVVVRKLESIVELPYQGLSDILLQNKVSGKDIRAIYDDERRSVHANWWLGSAAMVDYPFLPSPDMRSILSDETGHGFSVTPAAMSTFGSILTVNEVLCRIKRCHSDADISDGEAEVLWIQSLGSNTRSCYKSKYSAEKMVWSEYTLYRLALDKLRIFDELHIMQDPSLKLHCHDIWFSSQLPWDFEAAHNSECLFSVIQSSAGISPNTIWAQLKSHINAK